MKVGDRGRKAKSKTSNSWISDFRTVTAKPLSKDILPKNWTDPFLKKFKDWWIN